jgi:hypothetical protein
MVAKSDLGDCHASICSREQLAMMKWTLPLAMVLVACRSAQHQEDHYPVARVSAMDTAIVRRLCAQPDSVLAGRRSCELLDQGPRIKRF